ncbi:MAG: hypothetical protein ACTTH8_03745 [Treponema sp.]
MKKILVVFFQLLHLTCFIYADFGYKNIIQQAYPSAAEIESAGSYNSYKVFIVVYQSDWAESLIIYNEKNRKITECSDITEHSVYSARIITAYSRPFIEVVGMTHSGNGRIYLLDFDGKVFFSYVFLDYHHENLYFDSVKDIPVFKHHTPAKAESYSRVISGGTLHIDYSRFASGFISIFGTVQYLAVQEQNNTEKVIGSIKIERIFKRTDLYNDSLPLPDVQTPGREYNTEYKLIKKTGTIDSIFGYDF